MSSIQELEATIAALSQREQEGLYAWIDERHEQAIDAKLARAIDPGALDERIRQALKSRVHSCSLY